MNQKIMKPADLLGVAQWEQLPRAEKEKLKLLSTLLNKTHVYSIQQPDDSLLFVKGKILGFFMAEKELMVSLSAIEDGVEGSFPFSKVAFRF